MAKGKSPFLFCPGSHERRPLAGGSLLPVSFLPTAVRFVAEVNRFMLITNRFLPDLHGFYQTQTVLIVTNSLAWSVQVYQTQTLLMVENRFLPDLHGFWQKLTILKAADRFLLAMVGFLPAADRLLMATSALVSHSHVLGGYGNT